jgi:hypothetical protein
MPDERKTDRFAQRRDPSGWTVYEIWSGEAAVVAGVAQIGLSEGDAKHVTELLNRRAKAGDSSMRQ